MAHNPARGKPASGPGNNSPKAEPFTAETARTLGKPARSKNQMLVTRAQELKAADDSLPFFKAKTLAWKELYPDEAAERERAREVRAMIAVGTEDALVALNEVIKDKDHKDRVTAAKAWVEHDIGRPKQAVELTGRDGGAVEVKEIRRVIVDPKPQE